MSLYTIECSNLSKTFDGVTAAVYDLNLTVQKGEILALLGPSGCGKTTTLRMIAGFERPSNGIIRVEGNVVANGQKFVPPEKRGISLVFQEHALFPHLTAFENVLFGLKKNEESRKQANFYLRLVGLENLGERYPHALSGGERQRVALARAMAPQPVLILFDEPFSNLDADRRARIREEVRAILKASGSTAIFVTHDQEEALFMGDRLAVLNAGRLEQIGTPEEIFHSPATRFVAEFMGSTDFLPGEVAEDGIMTEIGFIEQPTYFPNGTPVEIAIRFDDVAFEPAAGEKSIVLARYFKGAYNIYRLRLPSGRLLHAMQPHTRLIRPGTPVRVYLEPGHRLTCFHEERANS
ncbi:MAG TPA: ABC transporter ATP-binding protein [Anaerolineales bacterium]|nr:ABC transporter ATP-binding protein [Anaerolineales bacterium]